MMQIVADGTEPPWFGRVRGATTSWTRFRVLDLATRDTLTGSGVASAIGCDPKSAKQHLVALEDVDLLHRAGTSYEITANGRSIHALVSAADGHPGTLLYGHRLLGIQYNRDADRVAVRTVLEQCAELVLRADGDLDLIAVLADEPDVVADLEQDLQAAVRKSVRVRLTR